MATSFMLKLGRFWPLKTVSSHLNIYVFRWACFFFSPGGLDTLVRDLVVEDRRKISSWLNEKTSDGKLQVYLVFNLFYANRAVFI